MKQIILAALIEAKSKFQQSIENWHTKEGYLFRFQNNLEFGICNHIALKHGNDYYLDIREVLKNYKPDDKSILQLWFPRTKEGAEFRVLLLTRAIEDLEVELSQTT